MHLQVMQESRVCLAPIRFGAGLKGKLTDAMQAGTPSVTTTTGAEGMNGNMPWGGFIEDNPEAFANAAVKLYQEKNYGRNARQHGFEILNQRFASGKESSELLKKSKRIDRKFSQNIAGITLLAVC